SSAVISPLRARVMSSSSAAIFALAGGAVGTEWLARTATGATGGSGSDPVELAWPGASYTGHWPAGRSRGHAPPRRVHPGLSFGTCSGAGAYVTPVGPAVPARARDCADLTAA